MRPLAITDAGFQAYRIRNLADGKIYIGITSRSLKERWAEHLYESRRRRNSMTISAAIAKHGPENFIIEPICSARSWTDICEAERLLINQYDCRAPRGYNLREGGEGAFGYKRSADAIERSAAKHRGRPCHPNTRLAGHLTHFGKPKSAETRARMSAARTGVPLSLETRRKLSEWRKGKSFNQGSTNGGAKLTENIVGLIRDALSKGATQRSQARKYSVSFTAIWKIANGLKWRTAA